MSRILPFVLTAALNLSLVLFMPAAANTQEAPEADPSQIAAFLFAYDIPPGMQTRFEEGYHRHLEWHRQAKDPLVWYGWYVMTGDKLGRFVDGTFGHQQAPPSPDLGDSVRRIWAETWVYRSDLSYFPDEAMR